MKIAQNSVGSSESLARSKPLQSKEEPPEQLFDEIRKRDPSIVFIDGAIPPHTRALRSLLANDYTVLATMRTSDGERDGIGRVDAQGNVHRMESDLIHGEPLRPYLDVRAMQRHQERRQHDKQDD